MEGAKSYKPNKVDWLEGDWTGLSTASFDERRGVTSIQENDFLNVINVSTFMIFVENGVEF